MLNNMDLIIDENSEKRKLKGKIIKRLKRGSPKRILKNSRQQLRRGNAKMNTE